MVDRTPRDGHLPHVVVLGGGFAGLRAARLLRRAPVRVTVVDRRNHHLFQPLLYQVAAAALNPSDIAYPIRAVLRRQRNTDVVLGEAMRVDLARRRVELDWGQLDYDFLIVATGARHSYFGRREWARFAPGLKSIEDALDIRRRVLLAFEAAERDPQNAAELLTFVIVGGGPTGVELAGSFIEIARYTLASDFRHIDPRRARVVLVEGGPRVLAAYPDDLSAAARRQLEALGVEVHTDSLVTAVDAEGVACADRRIRARTVFWAAGVQASELGATLGVPIDRVGRVRVCPDLSVPDHPEVFVVGDLAAAESDGKPVPGVAPAAIQGGAHAARCIIATLRGEPHPPFRYRDRGSLATIGRAAAVADVGRLHFSGILAWLAWLFIHIAYLIGFRNRVFVLLSWTWSYVTFQRGARLITGAGPDLLPARPPALPPRAGALTTPLPSPGRQSPPPT